MNRTNTLIDVLKNSPPETILQVIKRLPPSERVAIIEMLEELNVRQNREASQKDFMSFVRQMWPDFIEGAHHRRMAAAFERLIEGKSKRLILNLPPRHTKSEFGSYLLPSWFLGRFPNKQIIQASHTTELAVKFGRNVRNLLDSENYRSVFPDVSLRADSKAAGRWNTNHNGVYHALGVGSAVAGIGADLFIIDDPIDEQTAMAGIYNPEVYNRIYDWYTTGPRQRLQPGGRILLIQTRWSKIDLTGQVLRAAAQRGGEQWEVIEFPAILPSGNPLWPEFWSLESLEAIRTEIPANNWNAQYMQNPTSDNAAIVKREWWRWWEHDEPPRCDFVIQTWDTAHETKTVNDYSACQTWGVWYNDEDKKQPNIILLNAVKKRLEFPDLKARARQEYEDWEPDSLVVEKKASGASLIQELRRMGISVVEYSPGKGQDKISRLNAVADIVANGKVWLPQTRWAEELVDEVASFPAGEHDDQVDAMTLALSRFREGGYLRLDSDEPEEEKWFKGSRRKAYY